MLDVKDPKLLKYVPNYGINLISPAKMTKEDLEKFKTELRQVFECIKYSKDKEKLNDVMRENDAYKHISRRTAVLLNEVAGLKMKISRRKEEINMCKAIEDMIEDAKNEVRKEEREKMCKGIADMIEDAKKEEREKINKEIEKAKNEGRKEERIDTLSSLVNKGIINISQAAEEAGMTVPEFEAKMKAKA